MAPDALAAVGTVRIGLLRNGLRIMALRAVGDSDTAEDIVQEVMLRALRVVTPEITSNDERLGAFVGGIARHVIADAHRAARRTRRLEPAIGAGAVDEDALANLLAVEERTRVRKALSRLSGKDQIILRASFFEGLTPAEIAERVAEPVARVRKRKSRALERLRAVLLADAGHDSAAEATMKDGANVDVVAQGGG